MGFLPFFPLLLVFGFLLEVFPLRRYASEDNVGTASGDVGGQRDGALAAGFGHDMRFALVVLRVQGLMLDAAALKKLAQVFVLFNRDSAQQHRTARGVQSL